jgi:hypothetical protein
MSSATSGSSAVDKARALLCQVFARMVNAGSTAVRTRIVQSSGEPVEAWFYAHSDDGWQKDPGGVTDRELVRALHESLEMLASKKHGDEWSARQQSSGDWLDTDIQFHRDKLEKRGGKKLESALMGLLFRDSHDSKKDVRRSIRTRH